MLIFIFILDIDECKEMNIICPGSNMKCYNSIGSYICGCEPGYTEFEDYCFRKYMQYSIYISVHHEKYYHLSVGSLMN